MKYKKTYVKNKSKLDLYYFVFMVIVSGFFMILPLLSVFVSIVLYIIFIINNEYIYIYIFFFLLVNINNIN